MNLKDIVELIDTKNSWGKVQLKEAILDLLSKDIPIEYKKTLSGADT